MRRFVCHVVVLFLAGPLCGQYVSDSSLSIRLFAALKPEVAVFTARSGDYVAEAPAMEPLVIKRDEPVLIFSSGGRVGIRTLNQVGFLADGVRLRAVGGEGGGADSDSGSGLGSGLGSGSAGQATGAVFSLSIPGSGIATRYFTDGLSCQSDDGIFLLLNETTVERYLPGLVRTEGGTGNAAEFNKAQSVIARTFAWQNRGRHVSDGHDLCDDVHCQAYHGMSGDGPINEAVKATAGLVITSRDSMLIAAAFHSNCGGETASSADVWLAALPYLQSVKDPYCTASRNAVWRATISADAWRSFLVRNGMPGSGGYAGLSRVAGSVSSASPSSPASPVDPSGPASSASLSSPSGPSGPSGTSNLSGPSGLAGSPGNGSEIIFQQLHRIPFFEPGNGLKLRVAAIRNEFGLRSSFFTITASGDSLVLNGRGYGHGVGLCQEGAMEMAKRGHKFGEIISFYYNNVILMNVASVRFPPKLN